ncbi:MAG: hypothetical protein LC135_02705 [Phycisphaerae bacterium]|nr:hypothetical protein [Phycisphaerae bacterium]MCZ2398765.1 hypothetical protein [Phycisphaerae bacterium]NUQ49033.1 hypothetical protein [Phycisphaerae bacterium]
MISTRASKSGRRSRPPAVFVLGVVAAPALAQPQTWLELNANNPNPNRRTWDLHVDVPHESGLWVMSSLRVVVRHGEFFDFFGGPAACCTGNFFGQPWEYSTFVTTPQGLPNSPTQDAMLLAGTGISQYVWASNAKEVLWSAANGRACEDRIVARLTLQNLRPGWRMVVRGAHATTAAPFVSYPFEFEVRECSADLDDNGAVGQSDLGIVLAAYGSCPGDPLYIPGAGELAGGPCVGQEDLGVVLGQYGCGHSAPLRIEALPAQPAEAAPTDTVLFRARVTPAQNPPSQGVIVRLNNYVSASLAMFDDGTNGDEVPGDGIYSRAVVAQNVSPPGRGAFAVNVSDQQGRRAADFAELLVLFPGGCPAAGDLDQNGRIDRGDLAWLMTRFGCEGEPPGCPDLTGDNRVDNADVAALLAYFGCEAP